MAKNVRRGRGEGSIVKRPDGRWEARLDLGIVNGRRRYRSLYGRTRTDVAAALRHAHTTLEAGVPLPDGRTTVAVFLRHWVTNVLPGTVREATLDSYRSNVEVHLIPALGHVRLRQLTPEHVEQLLQAKAAAGLSANSRRLIRATLRRALGVAERRGQVARNVAALVDGPRTDTPKRRALTVDEAHRLLLAIRDDRFEALYLLLLELGLRKGEALGLQWRDLDLRNKTVTVVRSLGRHSVMDDHGRRHTELIAAATKTDGSGRTLHISPVLADALIRRRKVQAEERLAAGASWQYGDFVFTSTSGAPLDPANLRRSFDAMVARAEIGRLTPHELRHSAASILLAQGVALHVVSEMLGHSSIRITKDVYGHLVADETRAASAQMAAALYDL